MSTANKLMGQTRLLVGDSKLDVYFKGVLYIPFELSFFGGAPEHYLLFLGLTNKDDLMVTGVEQRVETLTARGEHTYRMDFAKVLKLEDVLKCTRTGFFFNRKNPGLSFLDNLGKLIDSVGQPTRFENIMQEFNKHKLEHLKGLNEIINFFEKSNFNKHPDIQAKLVSAREELEVLRTNEYGTYSSTDMNI